MKTLAKLINFIDYTAPIVGFAVLYFAAKNRVIQGIDNFDCIVIGLAVYLIMFYHKFSSLVNSISVFNTWLIVNCEIFKETIKESLDENKQNPTT
jgi:hypothetical protein